MKKILIPVLVGGLLAIGSLGCQGQEDQQQQDGFFENGEQQQNGQMPENGEQQQNGQMPENGENGYYGDENREMQNGQESDTLMNDQQNGNMYGDTATDTTDGMDPLDERTM